MSGRYSTKLWVPLSLNILRFLLIIKDVFFCVNFSAYGRRDQQHPAISSCPLQSTIIVELYPTRSLPTNVDSFLGLNFFSTTAIYSSCEIMKCQIRIIWPLKIIFKDLQRLALLRQVHRNQQMVMKVVWQLALIAPTPALLMFLKILPGVTTTMVLMLNKSLWTLMFKLP